MPYTSREACLPGINYTSRQVYEYISRQTNDPIVERKTCAISGQQFPIYASDLEFYNKISPTFAGEKFQIPTPTLCPEERHRRRLSFRNERKLYKRQCDASKKSIISIYSPDKPYKVYDQKIRWSDARDPMDYGMDFDFSKTFTENFKKLLLQVPTMNLFVTPDAEENNCKYVNSAGFNKDCYLIFDSDQNENCMHSVGIKDSKNCMEVLISMKCEYSYEMIYCVGCYNCKYCFFSTLCVNCIGCRSCISCDDCFGCYGLKNKQYCICNKQYSKEEYEKLLPTFVDYNYTSYPKEHILPGTHNMIQTCNEIIGSSLAYCKDTTFCFNCSVLQDSKYSDGIMNGTADLYDHSSFGEGSQKTLECEGTGRRVNNILYGRNIFLDSRDILYSRTCCQGSHNLFGCIGLRNRSYCIFNKQYSKEDYEIMVGKIIRHMMSTGERGEFFHPSLSPFGYNETVAQEYYPFEFDGNRRDALVARPQGMELLQDGRGKPTSLRHDYSQFGYHRSTYSSDPKIPDGVKTIDCRLAEWAEDSEQWKQLNEQVVGFLDSSLRSEGQQEGGHANYDICKQIILCEISGRPFMLQKAEIDFYRKHHISLPRKHPDIRHEERMKLRPGRTLYLRNCDCCGKEMLSVYDCRDAFSARPQGIEYGRDALLARPQQQSMVYCEPCYTKEIYG